MDEKQTTKECPKCKNVNLLLLRSMNRKVCTDCGTIIEWYLDKDQKPLICCQR